MKRLAIWASVVLFPACCVFTNTGTSNPAHNMTLVEQLEDESPALIWWSDGEGHHTYDPDEATSKFQLVPYCTSVWVSADTLLTAEHCVDDINKPEESDDDDPTAVLQGLLEQLQQGGSLSDVIKPQSSWTPVGQPVLYSMHGDIDTKHKAYHSGKVTAVDMVNDLALIKADSPGQHAVARLRRGTIHEGEELHIVGMPAGAWWTYMHGYVAGDRPQYKDGDGHVRPIMQVSAPVFFGNSGGGAFDAEGNLVGIADAISRVPETAFFIPRDVIRGFLEHNKVIAPDPKAQ